MADQNQFNMTQLLDKISKVAGDGKPEAGENGLDKYLELLIADRKFPDLTPEVKNELKKDLSLRLDDFIAARVITAFSDADVETFNKMLDENKSAEEIQNFTLAHIPDFENFLINTLLEFRGVYLGIIEVPAFVDVDVKTAAEEQIKENQTSSVAAQPFQTRPTKLPPAPVMPDTKSLVN